MTGSIVAWIKTFFKHESTAKVIVVGVGITLSVYLLKRPSVHALEYLCWKIGYYASNYYKKHRPHTLILVRTGESQANIDPSLHARIPDHQICLTERGLLQADEIGKKLRAYISKDDDVTVFVSPFERAKVTAQKILNYFPSHHYFEDPRLRDQEWGNLTHFQNFEDQKRTVLEERGKVGKFFIDLGVESLVLMYMTEYRYFLSRSIGKWILKVKK